MRSITTGVLISLLSLATVASTGPVADDITISGTVVEHETADPIPGALVRVLGLEIATLTDTLGEYRLVVPEEDVREEADEIRVVVTKIGYRTEQITVDAARTLVRDVVTADFRLSPESLALDEVVVTGSEAIGRNRLVRPAEYESRAPEIGIARSAPGAPGWSGGTPPRHSGWNREQYAHIRENGFLGARDNPLSTFSIDVDRASYSNVRRFLLRERRLPPVDAVQIEEMINYFSYDYELPHREHPIAVTTELGATPWHDGHQLLRIGLASRPVETEELPPNNLVFLLDVSGSMRHPNKLPLVKHAMRMLVNELRPQDRVAIVVYAGAAGLVLESTPGNQKRRILHAIERLEAGGSTAGGAGIRLAYRVARDNFVDDGNNRVILATDGDFNVGPSSDSEMVRLIEEKREEGTFLTVLGVGTGNLQSEKMQSLAQNGNGNYAYLDSRREARKVLVEELGGTLLTVAKDVKLQVEFNPSRVRAYRLIGYENRLLADEDFDDDEKDAGDLGAGHRVTALYEIVPVGVETDVTVGQVDPLRYQRPSRVSDPSGGEELAFVRLRYKTPRGERSRLLEHAVTQTSGAAASVASRSDDFRFAAAVAAFGMLLRESEHRGSVTSGQILSLATEGIGEDPEGYRRGFLELVRAYRTISGESDREPDGEWWTADPNGQGEARRHR